MAPRKKNVNRKKKEEEKKIVKEVEDMKEMKKYESEYEIIMPKMPEFECFSYLSKSQPSSLVNNDPKVVSFNTKFRNSVLSLVESGHLKVEDALAMFGVQEFKIQNGEESNSLPYGASESQKLQYLKDKIKYLNPLDHAHMIGHLSL